MPYASIKGHVTIVRYTQTFPMRYFLLVLLALAIPGLRAQNVIAFTGAKIIPVTGPEIPAGVLVIEDHKIVAVGPTGATQIPAGAKQVDATGKVIMPGLVDSHSHIGAPEGGDSSAPIQPDVRVLDSINVRDAHFDKARAAGVTTANVMPGSGHLMSGQTLYLKLRPGKTIDELLIKLPDGRIAGGMKMANGTNPRRPTPFPGTRGKSAALDREIYIKAQEYRDKVLAAKGDASKLPPRDLGMEALGEVLDGKRTVQFHTHRADDIMSVIRLSQEFHFPVVLHHVSEGWVVADEIARAKVPVSLIVIDSPGGKEEAKDAALFTAATLDKAGVLFGFHTDDPIIDSRLLLREAGLAVRAGLPRDKAIYGLTMANARILGLDSRVGSLQSGKDADFILLSGDPLSVYTHVLETWIEGKKVFDRNDPKDRIYATGGVGASHDQTPDTDDDEVGEENR
ncbi:MAG: amidohydrolase family protein [Acidobacteriaceae bacterium]|nr:amidohydrolase family protein [Acidobacteriaceae bacterium]